MPGRFETDRRLTVRMAVTLFLLGLLYVAFVAALIALLKSWVLVVVIAAAALGAQYWFSDRIALYAMRGRVVDRSEYPALHGVVDRLSALAGLPGPAVAVADTNMPNAFATGRSADHAGAARGAGAEPVVPAVGGARPVTGRPRAHLVFCRSWRRASKGRSRR